ncbi:ABC transporter substrate-binding protein [Bacillus sp. JJ1773]|uniref:ABC transporter substrate-binding protein n=1 Tax=Bacillus sp. JJ1773 TaxID=3122965 RepID=UPI002FFE518E
MKSTLTKMKLFTCLLVLSILLIGCSSTESVKDVNTEKDAQEDVVQEIVVAIEADPVGLSPTRISDINSYQTTNHMYENLFRRDSETGEIVPHLATSYENPDDNTWIFELREGVKFHDGTLFNAEAVKYTFEQLVDPDTAAPGAHYLKFMEGIEVVDEYTVKMTTNKPNADVLPVLALSTLAIISPESDQNQNLMEKPVGTGPFKFESWTRGDRVVMTKNENYWGDEPKLDKLTFVTVPNASTALSMLETGDADVVATVEVENISRVESMKNAKLFQTEGSGSYFFTFNMEKEPMNDFEFRKAVAMGIDAKSFVNQLGGNGFYSPTLFGPAVTYYDESVLGNEYEYDPEAARKIIEEKGYDQYELTLYTTSDRQAYKRMAEVTQAQLSEIGLNTKIEMMEWGTFLEATGEGKQDLFVINTSNSMTGLETMYGFFHSDGIGGNNRSQYSNPDFDELVFQARQTLDEEKRQTLINTAHQQVIKDIFMVPMFHSKNTLGLNKSVEGVIVLPNGVINLSEAYKQ